MAESEMDSFSHKVLRRARELGRIKAGKASETVTNVSEEALNEQVVETPRNSGSPLNLNIDSRRHVTSDDHHAGNRDRGEEGLGGSRELWDRLSKMEEMFQKREDQQTEILSNIVVTVAKMQRKMDGDESVESEDCNVSNVSDITSVDKNMDVNELFETESTAESGFLTDLEKSYREEEEFGKPVNSKLSKLVENALSQPLHEESLRLLEDEHRVPENCKSLGVPKVNRELWQAFKPARQSDLALQNSQKSMSMALVSVIKTLDVLMTEDGDKRKIREYTKDTFRILAHGMHVNTKKRKELIQPLVPTKYRKVCQGDAKPSSFLFGEDLDQKVDNLEKEDRRSQKLSGRSFLGHGFPYGNLPTQSHSVKQRHQTKPMAVRGRRHGPKYQGKPYPKGQWNK